MKTLIVNLFGGPGAGKSTTRAGLFHLLKLDGASCEEVVEWIKYKVYEESTYVMTDQLYVFAKQRKWLRHMLGKVEIVITDSPILLSAIYDKEGDSDFYLNKFNEFDNLNFYINRVKPYNPVGRYQDEKGAKRVDETVLNFLSYNDIPFYTVDGDKNAPEFIKKYIDIYRGWPV